MAIAVVLVLTSGCRQGEEAEATETEATETEATETEATETEATEAKATETEHRSRDERKAPDVDDAAELAIREDSVGPITGTTSADVKTLASLLSEAEVSEDTYMAEGDEYQVFRIIQQGELILEVRPGIDGTVSSISVVASGIETAAGIGVGASYAELTAIEPELTCVGGVEDHGSKAFCRGASESPVYVFEAGTEDHYANEIPADQQEALLGSASVEQINVRF